MNILKNKLIYGFALLVFFMASCKQQSEVTPANNDASEVKEVKVNTKAAIVSQLINVMNSSTAAQEEIKAQLKAASGDNELILTQVLEQLNAIGIDNKATKQLKVLAAKAAQEQKSVFGEAQVMLRLINKDLPGEAQVLTYEEAQHKVNLYNLRKEVAQLDETTPLTSPAIAVEYAVAVDPSVKTRQGNRTYIREAYCKNDHDHGPGNKAEMYAQITYMGYKGAAKKDFKTLNFWHYGGRTYTTNWELINWNKAKSAKQAIVSVVEADAATSEVGKIFAHIFQVAITAAVEALGVTLSITTANPVFVLVGSGLAILGNTIMSGWTSNINTSASVTELGQWRIAKGQHVTGHQVLWSGNRNAWLKFDFQR